MKLTDLTPGVAYVAVQSFTDGRGTTVLAGDVQTVVRVTVAPVTAEIAVECREETLYFREDITPDVVEHAERYLAPADTTVSVRRPDVAAAPPRPRPSTR